MSEHPQLEVRANDNWETIAVVVGGWGEDMKGLSRKWLLEWRDCWSLSYVSKNAGPKRGDRD